ncbi:MAG: sigma-70 family RNA polymerase sigma factor [Fimbriimonadales bacterium]|nr:sigma-70 family RNA polymerase sigma factor [Fimbriimonadales bacterium]MDW8051605.1 sigma-70 family RNA polymerase sigma factor [Armatimonadota bacterium]
MEERYAGAVGSVLTDEQLAAKARAGDTSAMEELYLRYRQPIFRIVYRSTRNADEAEDIVQEVFLKAFERLHTFREQSRFSTWLMRIALNLCTDRARMRQRRQLLVEREAEHRLAWSHPKPPDPLESVRRYAFEEAFYTALHQLPAHHQQLIIMRDLEEMDYEQIAEILGVSVGAVKLRVMRARRAFKAKLEPLLRAIGEIE